MDAATDPKSLAPFLAQLRKWDDEELMEAASQVRAVLEHPGWGVVGALIDVVDERATYELRFLPVKDHAEMSRAIGFSAGMAVQKAAAQAVLREADAREKRRQERADREEELVR